jgi:Ca2+-binding RTX toxin-like protein
VIDKGGLGIDTLFQVELIWAPVGKSNTIDVSSAGGLIGIDTNLSERYLNVFNIPGIGFRSFSVENFVNVIGTNNRDYLEGTSGNNFLDGRGGNDGIFGQAGNDTLIGGSGSEYIVGGTGTDRLLGTDGASRGREEVDDLQGDSGNDRFVFGDRTGSYYKFNGTTDFVGIRDFSVGDRIELGLRETYRTQRTDRGFQLFVVTGGVNEFVANVNTTSFIQLPTGNFTIASGQVRACFIGA